MFKNNASKSISTIAKKIIPIIVIPSVFLASCYSGRESDTNLNNKNEQIRTVNYIENNNDSLKPKYYIPEDPVENITHVLKELYATADSAMNFYNKVNGTIDSVLYPNIFYNDLFWEDE